MASLRKAAVAESPTPLVSRIQSMYDVAQSSRLAAPKGSYAGVGDGAMGPLSPAGSS